jgi:phosphoglycolate phosphatase-like HAD superfamily hydrolase
MSAAKGLSPVAVIFDMDGLMVDSEPHWVRAEQEAFAEVGVTLSDDDCKLTKGLRLDCVVQTVFVGGTSALVTFICVLCILCAKISR